jgi:ATP-dependent helicase/nuclease subunit A
MSADQSQRMRAIEATDRSLVVEASAGTGKTTILIRRILHCVLERGPSGVPIPLSRICAITFTEKAAGEMKIRLRQEFERRARAAGSEAERARQALLDLESAAISTFHSFAVSLLKERPIEAGLDPRFTALNEVQGDLLFDEVWDLWLQRAIQDRRDPLEQALRRGLGLDALRSAAIALRKNAHTVRRLRLPAPPTEEEMQQQLRDLLQQGRTLQAMCLNPADKLLPLLENALDWIWNPSGGAAPAKPGSKGAAGNWKGEKKTVEMVREFIRSIVQLRVQLGQLPAQRALEAMLRLMIAEFLPEWEAHKRAKGYLDFDDQLWCAYELLSSSSAARKEFQERYTTLLVDEFQDTDPIQWEIVHLLAASPGGLETGQGKIAPGRLFIVGDPKQSIYRFRGADIETYANTTGPAAMKALALDGLELTTNFRSVPSILRFVDEAFHDVMTASVDKPFQPKYLAFGGQGARAEKAGSPCVYLLGDRNESGGLAGSGREFIKTESTRIAGLVALLRGNAGWEIQSGPGGNWRVPRLGDIAVLLPVLTHADALEDALREAGIPYVLEGGKFYYTRSEVSSAITVLRSVSNPNDSIALYGALRSIFFGLSDVDLLRARMEGQPLDYRAEVPSHSALYEPYRLLHDLHLRRHERLASETLESLLHNTGVREVLVPRGVQSLANLGKLVRTLRSLQADATFSGVVELISGMDEEGAAESESRIMEEHSDAVRILSIHRAKGLDFPIVIVAGLGLQRRSRNADFLADPHGGKVFGLSLGSKESGLQTPCWNELVEKDKERDDAELTRLLYVALTRARDHLVLCTHTRGKRLPDTDRWAANFEKTRLKPLETFLSDVCDTERPIVNFLDAASLAAAAAPRFSGDETQKGNWRSALSARYGELDRLLSGTPAARGLSAAASGTEDLDESETDLDLARDRAVRLGIAFHEAMDRADLTGDSDVGALAEEAGMRQRLDGAGISAMRDLLNRSLGSPLMARAARALRAGGRILRELPYVRPLDLEPECVEEGKIDLLFEEADGWVLVDYKTDHLAKGQEAATALARKYGGQVNAYVSALKALGIRVKSAYLLLARTGEHIEVPI